MRHINIPVFIPHLGCPNNCVFCNQRTISGVKSFDPSDTRRIIDDALSTVSADDEVEIAFFGGSFTGIDFDLMTELLQIAYSYIERGAVKSVRCSTRPDYIDENIIKTLKRYGVSTVELGLQSIDPEVLRLSKRNHTATDAVRACKLIVDSGITLVGQMMIGLPGSTIESEIETTRFIIDSGAVGARIYPTVVFRDTELCDMAAGGDYTPLSLEDAVTRSAATLRLFRASGVKVIRIGLCSSENLLSEETYFAGPNHPSLGELVENKLYFDDIYDKAKYLNLKKEDILLVKVARGTLSKAIGQKRKNKTLLTDTLGVRDVVFREDCVTHYIDVSVLDK
ncbi:MAG: radical SAM protein [Clostridia bacterium]|nr:radical SAM protein [Clostridia bacterium]